MPATDPTFTIIAAAVAATRTSAAESADPSAASTSPTLMIVSMIGGCVAVGAMVAGAVIAYKYKKNTRTEPIAVVGIPEYKDEEKAEKAEKSEKAEAQPRASISELPPLHVNIGRRDPWNKYVQSIQEFPVKNKRESWLIAMEELHTAKTWEFEHEEDD